VSQVRIFVHQSKYSSYTSVVEMWNG
jgi:hypothetical protein